MLAISLTCVTLLLATEPDAAAGRRYHEISRDLSTALRREATSADLVERGAAVRQLVALFHELDRDPRTPTSEYLQEYRGKVRGRLVSVQAQLKQQIARAERAAKRSSKGTVPNNVEQFVIDQEQRQLAQQLTAQVALASYTSGGPSQVFEAAGGAWGGGAVIGDNGEELVELIETTISPQAWAANGGPCTIVYYRPLMCLVVRATGDTHRHVNGLLEALR